MAVAPSNQDQNYVVSRSRRCCVKYTVGLLLCLATVFILWPSRPELKVVRLKVKRAKVHPVPRLSVELWLSVAVRVHNGGACWMELSEVDVGVRYRGKKLGHVELEDGHVRGWGSSYVEGELEYGELAMPEVMHLVEDLAKGRVSFRTITQVEGQAGLLFFHLPLTFEAKVSCEVLVNTKKHTIVSQHCHYES